MSTSNADVRDIDLFGENKGSSVVDARWLMAFAAAIGDTKAIHLDTTVDGGLVGHPLFSVCVEWPVLLASRRGFFGTRLQGARSVVHCGHAVAVHRLVRPDDKLVTSTRVLGIETKNSGVLVHQEFRTVDQAGLPVATTFYSALALGAHFSGPDEAAPASVRAGGQPSTPPRTQIPQETTLVLTAGAAHIYTEGSRIFNPIHTDRQVAINAGMDRPILHGTATLAMAVTEVVDHVLAGDPAVVSSITGRFNAPVTPPCVLRVRWWLTNEPTVPFCVLGPGETAVCTGSVTHRMSGDPV